MKKISLIAALLLSLVACGTPYQETGLTGGVSSTMIAPATAQVSVKVNAYTDRSTAFQYAMLKAAETTVQQGYGHFQVVDQNEYNKNTSSTSYNAFTNTFQTNNLSKPRVDAVIRMFSGPKPRNAPANVYDAQAVISTLGPQVRKPS